MTLKPLTVNENGELVGSRVEYIPSHLDWYNPRIALPKAIVAHCTNTDFGTARAMAKRHQRSKPQAVREDGKNFHFSSWHLTITRSGFIIQMLPLDAIAFHAGGPDALKIPGLGSANHQSVGIEYEGYGIAWYPEMIEASCRVWKAIVTWANIPEKHAFWGHRDIHKWKKDPGQSWYDIVLPKIRSYTYGQV